METEKRQNFGYGSVASQFKTPISLIYLKYSFASNFSFSGRCHVESLSTNEEHKKKVGS